MNYKIEPPQKSLDIFHINAFTDKEFGGNPAAVCLLKKFLKDEIMQSIAEQNNLSETAFVIPSNENTYSIRWFSPTQEVELCGHATLAAAYILFKHMSNRVSEINFDSRGGTLNAKLMGEFIELAFPIRPANEVPIPPLITEAINYSPEIVLASDDYIVVLQNQEQIASLKVDLTKLSQLDRRGVVFTAPGNNADFVSRVFHPKLGIGEDPVCGSAHCELMPYWSKRLGKTALKAYQLSPRGGEIFCKINNDHVFLKGKCRDYLVGKIFGFSDS